MKHGKLRLDGEDYVVVTRAEFDELTTLAKAARLPELPAADAHGNYPAVPYARASLARKLLRDRVQAGLSQRELARLAGIRFETLCRLEAGRHTPTLATMAKIDAALKRAQAKR